MSREYHPDASIVRQSLSDNLCDIYIRSKAIFKHGRHNRGTCKILKTWIWNTKSNTNLTSVYTSAIFNCNKWEKSKLKKNRWYRMLSGLKSLKMLMGSKERFLILLSLIMGLFILQPILGRFVAAQILTSIFLTAIGISMVYTISRKKSMPSSGCFWQSWGLHRCGYNMSIRTKR